jgi:hypothetical protein
MKRFIDHKNYRIKIVNIVDFNEYTKVVEIKITDRKKGIIGHGSFSWLIKKNQVIPGDVFINEDNQRQGIGNKMYSFVEQFTQSVMIPSKRQSDDAKAFWKQNKRPFGYKES